MDVVRILVADDQELIRKRVCSTLEERAGLQVCAEAANGQEAVEKTRELKPDLVILDITMPVLNGLDAARMIQEFSPQTPIVILSVHKSKQLMEEAQKVGVRGYVTKAEAGQNLVTAVKTVLKKGTYYPAGL
jgi:two-component system nitrate/nitrite response regulator NarL